jgi:AraC-like DNA-binding protein
MEEAALAELHAAVNHDGIAVRQALDGGWELAVGRPHPRLRPAVREYEGYREAMAQPMRRRELPAATIAVIINFGPPYRLLEPAQPDDATRAIELHGGFVAGLDDTFAVTESTGAAHCLQLNLAPLAAWRLFRRPMSDLARRVVAFDDLLGSEAALFTERLAELPTWATRFALLDVALMERIGEAQPPSPEVAWAWRQLARSAGCVPISTLTEELGWSPRRLIERFREQIGLPPKQTARLLRFQRAVSRLVGDESPDWCAFAQQHGYYDQAHLIHEFRQFAGDTPEGLLRRRIARGGGFSAD